MKSKIMKHSATASHITQSTENTVEKFFLHYTQKLEKHFVMCLTNKRERHTRVMISNDVVMTSNDNSIFNTFFL